MTVPYISYSDMKQQTSDVIARRVLLHNLKECRGNVRACSRRMRCSPHTVYRALRKDKAGHRADLSHRPRGNHPRHTPMRIEEMIIHYRRATHCGKRRLRYLLAAKEKLLIPESTIGKVLSRSGVRRVKRKRPSQVKPCGYNWEELYPFQVLEVDVKEILDKKGLPPEVYKHLAVSSLPRYQWTAIDPVTRIRFLSFSHKKDWFAGRVFLLYLIWWLRAFGILSEVTIKTDGGIEFAASSLGSFQRNLGLFTRLGVRREVIRKGHPEDNAFVERSHRTDDEEFYVPYLTSMHTDKDMLRRGIWWEKIYNLERPHQGIENMTPYEKLKSLGYPQGQELCLFPPLILDKVCTLDIFQGKKRKSVPDHIDYYQNGSIFVDVMTSRRQ